MKVKSLIFNNQSVFTPNHFCFQNQSKHTLPAIPNNLFKHQ